MLEQNEVLSQEKEVMVDNSLPKQSFGSVAELSVEVVGSDEVFFTLSVLVNGKEYFGRQLQFARNNQTLEEQVKSIYDEVYSRVINQNKVLVDVGL